VIANLNASPYHRGKRDDRERWVHHHATTGGVWLAYCNVVGGQDEVVFDGDSMLADPDGDIVARGAQFAEDLVVVDVEVGARADARSRPALRGHPGERLR
jgi:NAD+ synthase (glutamine-hydrolysing)